MLNNLMERWFLIIYFLQSKKNKEEIDQSIPWDVQSAPNNPVIPSMNSLEMHTF